MSPFRPALLLSALLLALVYAPVGAEPSVALTSVAGAKSLALAQPGGKAPVRIRGAVIMDEYDGFILHDGGEGVFVKWHHGEVPAVGNEAEVEGTIAPGDIAPILIANRVTITGLREVAPLRVAPGQNLASAAVDCQWVELEGVLRVAQAPPPSFQFFPAYGILAFGRDRLQLTFSDTPVNTVRSWVGARLRIRAACLHYFNPHGQMYAPRLVIPRTGDVRVIRRAPAPGELPIIAIASLLRGGPGGQPQNLVRIQGEVTAFAGASELYVQQDRCGVLVRHDGPGDIPVGTLLDVTGFVAPGPYSPEIEDARLRVAGPGKAVAPRPMLIDEARTADSELASVRGTVLDTFPGTQGTTLVLRAGGLAFTAEIPTSSATPKLPPVGAVVRVAGVVRVFATRAIGEPYPWKPNAFNLLLRSPADLTLLSRPPMSAASRLLLGASALAVLAAAWAAALWLRSRAKLRRQQHQRIAREVEFAAVVRERTRVAREIHDSLAQGFTAVSIQLEMARFHLPADPSIAAQHVETARSLVRESLAEARRAIHGLRTAPLSPDGFACELRRSCERLVRDTPIALHFDFKGDLSALNAEAQAELLRIATEAVTNAVRHAQPSRILVSLEAAPQHTELAVSDDGRGFDARQRGNLGFGLRGMHERARRLNGNLLVSSNPGGGTRLSARIPAQG